MTRRAQCYPGTRRVDRRSNSARSPCATHAVRRSFGGRSRRYAPPGPTGSSAATTTHGHLALPEPGLRSCGLRLTSTRDDEAHRESPWRNHANRAVHHHLRTPSARAGRGHRGRVRGCASRARCPGASCPREPSPAVSRVTLTRREEQRQNFTGRRACARSPAGRGLGRGRDRAGASAASQPL